MLNKHLYKIIITTLLIFFSIFTVWQPNINIQENKLYISIDTSEAHAEHMIVEGLEQGGSGGSTWVFDIWNFCLSLVNIFLIGVLIFLGVVNILHLNYDTYEIKKFLVPLIVGVLLANFSLFICRAIVDLSSALSGTFFENQEQISAGIMNGLGFSNAGSLIQLLGNIGNQALAATADLFVMIGYTIIGVVIGLILIILFLAITVLLYVRVFVVLILAAIAPLAFVSMILPSTQNYFRQWFGWFLRWTFMGPIIVLILKVAAILGNATAAPSTGAGFITMIVSFIAIIGLLILALMVPFILGGAVFGKIGEYAKKTAGAIGDNTHFGRAIRGTVSSFAESREQGLKSTELGYKEGVTAGYETYKSGGSFGEAKNEFASAYNESQTDLALKKYSRNFQSQSSFDDFMKSNAPSRLASQKPEVYSALMKEAASKGFIDNQSYIDKYESDLKKNKNFKGNISTDIDNLISINSKQRMNQGLFIPDLKNNAYTTPTTTSGAKPMNNDSYNAKKFLDNIFGNIHQVKSSSQREQIVKKAAQNIQTLANEGHIKEAKEHYTELSNMVENNPQYASFKSDSDYQALNKNSKLNSLNSHIGAMSVFLQTKPGSGRKSFGKINNYEIKNFQDVLSRQMNHKDTNDVRTMIHAHNALKSAGYDITNVNDFIDDYNKNQASSGRTSLGKDDEDFIRKNFSQMNEISKYSKDEQRRIIGK